MDYSKVSKDGVIQVAKKDVGGFDVAMHEASSVKFPKCHRDVPDHAQTPPNVAAKCGAMILKRTERHELSDNPGLISVGVGV